MKKLLLCTLLYSIAAQCSEQAKQLDLIKNIKCDALAQSLNTHYCSYLTQKVEEYKTTDYTPQTINNITRMSKFIAPDHGSYWFPYNGAYDSDGNNILMSAVKKMDHVMADWLVTKHGTHCITETDLKKCIDMCLLHLTPKKGVEVIESTRNTAYDILKTITSPQGRKRWYIWALASEPFRKNIIQQLVLLQLRHKKHQTNFVNREELIISLAGTKEDGTPAIALTDIYQQVADKKGNTLSHVVVNNQNPDELWELISKDYVSPAENKDKKTALHCAHEKFQSYSKDATLIGVYPEAFQRARCCLFMLLNYVKAQQDNKEFSSFTPCCPTHTVKK